MPDGNGGYKEYKSGDRVNKRSKQVHSSHPVFFMIGNRLMAYQQYYVRVSSSGSINLPVFLWTGAGFAEHLDRVKLSFGFFFGILFALFLYNLFLYVSTKDNDFLNCNFLLIAYALVQGAYFGVSTQYLWSDMIWWANKSLVISAAITFFSIAFYTNSFLKLKENSVVFYRFMLGFMWYYAILFVAAFFL